jgi:hypothetical protein
MFGSGTGENCLIDLPGDFDGRLMQVDQGTAEFFGQLQVSLAFGI